MEDEKCNEVQDEKQEVIDGYTIKYHANGKTVWSKGKMIEGKPEGYWNGTVLTLQSNVGAFYKWKSGRRLGHLRQ